MNIENNIKQDVKDINVREELGKRIINDAIAAGRMTSAEALDNYMLDNAEQNSFYSLNGNQEPFDKQKEDRIKNMEEGVWYKRQTTPIKNSGRDQAPAKESAKANLLA